MTFTEFFKRFLAVLFVLLLFGGLWAARSTLVLGFAAAMIAVGISIPSGWLQRRGLQRGWSIGIATMSVLIGILLLIFFVVPQLLTGFADLFNNLSPAIGAVLDFYENGRSSNQFLKEALPALPNADSAANMTPERARAVLNQFVDASLAIAPTLLGGVSTLVAVLVNLLLVIFVAIFFLVEPKIYVKASLFLIPKRHHLQAVHVWNELYHTARVWISTLSFSIGITAFLVWLILGVILGMPNAIVVAVFAGLATFVPNVGLFLPLIPIIIFSLGSGTPFQVLYTVPVYLIIQLIESNIISPSIVKAELEIPPGGLMLFQLLVTIAFGALGLLLAVPMMAILMVLVREIYSYGLLGLRDEKVELETNEDGKIVLGKTEENLFSEELEELEEELPPEEYDEDEEYGEEEIVEYAETDPNAKVEQPA